MAFLFTLLPLFGRFAAGDSAARRTTWQTRLGVLVLLPGHLALGGPPSGNTGGFQRTQDPSEDGIRWSPVNLTHAWLILARGGGANHTVYPISWERWWKWFGCLHCWPIVHISVQNIE